MFFVEVRESGVLYFIRSAESVGVKEVLRELGIQDCREDRVKDVRIYFGGCSRTGLLVKAEWEREDAGSGRAVRIEEVFFVRIDGFIELERFIFVGVMESVTIDDVGSVSVVAIELSFEIVGAVGCEGSTDINIVRWEMFGGGTGRTRVGSGEICDFDGDSVYKFGQEVTDCIKHNWRELEVRRLSQRSFC